MKNFKTSILKELKRKGDIFAVLHLGTMLKSKRCMLNGAGLKLDTSILKHKFMNSKYPAFEIIKQHLFQIEVLKDIILKSYYHRYMYFSVDLSQFPHK